MKQILQNLSSGETSISDVPIPKSKNGSVLIQTSKSLISIGTEKMLINFGKANLINKVRSQPEKVKTVIEKTKTDGLIATYEAVKSKLDQPLPLGYCNVGYIIDSSDCGFDHKTRVVSNGHHAEIVRVPKNLVAKIPDNVDDDSASFTVVGAIALQGIRLLNPTLGERVVVIGLGLIGLMAVQILKANGCRVLGVDFDKKKCDLAKKFGVDIVNISDGDDIYTHAESFSNGKGVDAVLVTASSKENTIIHEAAEISRKRGRIVLVGVVGLNINRADFYEKELSFQVSCSYGPGRYDKDYEEKGNDYPYGYVRWTEKRNFEAVLELMSSGLLDVKPLISNVFSFEDAQSAYNKLDGKDSLGIILDYQNQDNSNLNNKTVKLKVKHNSVKSYKKHIAFIGGGNYASRILIPSFKKAGATFSSLVTSSGISAVHHGKKNDFEYASTDINEAFKNETNAVVIATQHNLHAKQVIDALKNNKHVFIEKPLALNHEDIDAIEHQIKKSKKILMVGYNRRFAPLVQKMKTLLKKKPTPKAFIMTMNAGSISEDHWTQDIEVGGGRIIGEACHYIDLMRFLVGHKIKSFEAIKISKNDHMQITSDKAIISLTFEDGSIGSIHYLANGGKSFPKERIEVFCEDAVLQLDNFRKLKGFGWKGFNKISLWAQDKGQDNCSRAFVESLEEEIGSPISNQEIFEVARITIDIANHLKD